MARFSLIEILIAIAIGASITYLIWDSLAGKKETTDMTGSINTTTAQIAEGISQVGEASDRFAQIGAIPVFIKMGTKVQAEDTNNDLIKNDNTVEYIKSIGLNNLCKYYIAPDKDTNTSGTDNYGVQILMNCSSAATAFGWDDKQKKNAEDIFVKNMTSLSNTPISTDSLATAISTSAGNAAFTAGGSVKDAIVGIRYFSR